MEEPVRWIKSNPRWLRIFHRRTLFINLYLYPLRPTHTILISRRPTSNPVRKFRFFTPP